MAKRCGTCVYHETANGNDICCMYICITGHMRGSKADLDEGCDKYIYKNPKTQKVEMYSFGKVKGRRLTKEEVEIVRRNKEKERLMEKYFRETNGFKYE